MSAILTLSRGPSELSGRYWELIVRQRDSCRGSPNMAMKFQGDYPGAIAGSGAAMTGEGKEGDHGDVEANDQSQTQCVELGSESVRTDAVCCGRCQDNKDEGWGMRRVLRLEV